ncbi:MAG: ABC transporter permease [Phycisphaerales bacterium]
MQDLPGHPDQPDPSTNDSGAVLAMSGPPIRRDNPLTRSASGVVGLVFLVAMIVGCLGSLPWTLASVGEGESAAPRYNAGVPREARLPPSWWGYGPADWQRVEQAMDPAAAERLAEPIATEFGVSPDDVLAAKPSDGELYRKWVSALRGARPVFWLGSDMLGRSLMVRVLTGGGISLTIGIAAALISVAIGTVYGAVAGYFGGLTDAVLMRIVDVLYGLPYILLVVLLAVASDSAVEEYVTRVKERAEWVRGQAAEVMAQEGLQATERIEISAWLREHPDEADELQARGVTAVPARQISPGWQTALDVFTLLFAIASVSWLTMARVVRGQVLSLKNQQFVEAARAMGSPTRRIFLRHLLPNLVGPIVVYATLSVPQAILQESFLSFLGIGVKPPLPSWGNLAAEGLGELNTYRSHWWLLFFPCLLLGLTLLALNFVGEGLREAFDPKRARR